MKKLLLILAVIGCAVGAQADTMQFITVLSQPVGTFHRLEAVDSTTSAKSTTVNFCTKVKGTNGMVTLQGTDKATMNTITLQSGTTLKRADEGKYSLSNIHLKSGGTLTGRQLLGSTMAVKKNAVGKADNLYGKTITVAGAKTKELTIENKAQITDLWKEDPGMVWSNEYQDDEACKTEGCANQYLLKSQGSGPTIKPLDPVEPSTCQEGEYEAYEWVLTDPGQGVAGLPSYQIACNTDCVSTSADSGILPSEPDPDGNLNTSNVPALTTTKPAESCLRCSQSSDVESTRILGWHQYRGVLEEGSLVLQNGYYYCPTYTCKRVCKAK